MSLDARTKKLAETVFAAAQEIKAKDVIALDLSGIESYTDFIMIASGGSERQLSAIADNILKRVFEELHLHPIGVEGRGLSDWVLIDFGSVIVHLFFEETRKFYHLEDMWLQVKPIPETKIGTFFSGGKSKAVAAKPATVTKLKKSTATPKVVKSKKAVVKAVSKPGKKVPSSTTKTTAKKTASPRRKKP